jgi:DNA modification methylase
MGYVRILQCSSLDFPYAILEAQASSGEWVLDPFCGRGTTNYASRMLGLPSIGIDNSPVAAAISEAKLAGTSPSSIVRAAEKILDSIQTPKETPDGEFWEWAFQHLPRMHT